MFDELYNKAKKHLVPGKEDDSLKREVPSKETTPPQTTKTEDVVLPVAPKVPSTDAPSTMVKTTLSHEEQTELLKQRKAVPGWVVFLKYFSLLLTVVGIVGVVWLKADLDPNNKYFSLLSATDNTGSKHVRFKKLKKQMEQESLEYTGKIARIERQLTTKNYSAYTEQIQSIKEQQFHWIDSIDEKGNIVYGILDGPQRAADYFNSKSFDHSILSNTANNIIVSTASADRKRVRFGVEGAHLFGKAFFLNSEFVTFMNAFSIYKGGELNSFSKKKNVNGNQSMNFSLELALQKEGETDPNDDGFIKYEKWLQSATSKKQ